ncbi:hypothetical protein [Mammaliicoccus sp. Dog046]|uniref:glutamate racemase n=1 Tax=Mammaliicoccus sp. Dog046 TaxID=3034233 RepID=UPI002B25C42A|nr:hypothetical protein [Mammaliicoccus sp. Dog046]WQK85769.1 hypothetical protein P3U32_01670 [Mammaliicoccus sp. Dog046]
MCDLSHELANPIAIFDTGIGSYAIVEHVKEQFPKQDLIYLADRNQFPYGSKSKPELMNVIRQTIAYLETWNPSLIVVASNAPTITVLEEVAKEFDTEVIGVYPPIEDAIEASTSKKVGVLGVQSLIESDELTTYINQTSKGASVYKFDVSILVELVESGEFLTDKYRTLMTTKKVIDDILETHEEIDVFTLSSTHLPWLYSYFKTLYPNIMFINPAQTVIDNIGKKATKGNGIIKTLVTTNDNYTIEEFQTMLERLNVQLDIEEIKI